MQHVSGDVTAVASQQIRSPSCSAAGYGFGKRFTYNAYHPWLGRPRAHAGRQLTACTATQWPAAGQQQLPTSCAIGINMPESSSPITTSADACAHRQVQKNLPYCMLVTITLRSQLLLCIVLMKGTSKCRTNGRRRCPARHLSLPRWQQDNALFQVQQRPKPIFHDALQTD